MHSLPADLNQRCAELFNDCAEFDDERSLRPLFLVDELAPFADDLPKREGSRKAFVEAVKLTLLDTTLADGRPLLLPFLQALRGCYTEHNALYGELDALYRRARAHFYPPAPVIPPPVALNHYFICYAPRDGARHAERLHAALREAGLRPWLDARDTPADYDPDAARESALRECLGVLLVLTPGSADAVGECAGEWRLALRFKKPVIPLRFVPNADAPLALGRRVALDFTGDFDAALDGLRRHIEGLDSPAGRLRELEYRRADVERALRTARPEQCAGLQQDIDQLEAEITRQREVARDPQAAARATEQRIEAALERERQPERPAGGRATTKFINPPPLTAPSYFQDRHVENGLIADFLRDPARRLLTVVGRAGVGKTALVCRLLKALEGGALPDDLGDLPTRGIIYLSAVGSRRIAFPHLFEDLLKLLPAERRPPLEAIYKDPQASVEARLRPVWEAFAETARCDALEKCVAPLSPVIVLLDNLEDLLDPATHAFAEAEAEVEAALRALLDAPIHPLPVKVLLTTRIAPAGLQVYRPERQMTVPLDAGLPAPFAEAVVRAGDPTGALGLREADDARLAPAREYTRGFPRALEALTAALTFDRSITLEELLAGPPPENVVEALVGQAYSRLDPAAQRVMQALAVYNRPVPPAAVDYLLQPHLPDVDSTPILNRLVNARFVTKEAGRYYMHPVDRDYALARLPDGPLTAADRPPLSNLKRLFQEFFTKFKGWISSSHPPIPSSLITHHSLLYRAADYYRHSRLPRAAWKTLDDLVPQLAEFDLRCAAGDYDTAADVLTDIDFDYLLLWGHVRLMARLHERLQGKVQNLTLARISTGNLGQAYADLGQLEDAIAYYERALTSAREQKNRQAEDAWLGNLGIAYYALGRIPEAIAYYERALAIDREIGDRDGEGVHLGNLGIAYYALGRISEAIAYYERALAIAREIGDRRNEGAWLGNLGNAYLALGRILEAIEYQVRALTIAREIGDRHNEGAWLGNLGNAYCALGRIPEAIEKYEQALAISREIGNRNGEGRHLGNLAEALLTQGNLTAALSPAQESVAIAEELADPRLASYATTTLALIHACAGDFAAALAAAEAACAHDCPLNNAAAHVARGSAALRLGRQDAARAAFRAAIAAAQALPGYERLYAQLDTLGVAYTGLARVEPEQRAAHLQAAAAAFAAARAITSAPGVVKNLELRMRNLE